MIVYPLHLLADWSTYSTPRIHPNTDFLAALSYASLCPPRNSVWGFCYKKAKAKKDFGLTTAEGGRFLPPIDPIAPSSRLQEALEDLPWAIAVGSEKAKSEGIIYPILQEVRRLLKNQVSLFSGRDFIVDTNKGLNGYVDYLISRSQEQLEIEAPVVVVGEAKRDNLNEGLGQCIAEMVAAQMFNQANQVNIPTIYGSLSNGTQWRFLKLEGSTVTIDLMDYALPPVDQILGFLVWMVRES